MQYTFQKLDSNPERFFDILPQDWQDDIVPFWDLYKDSSQIYILAENSKIIGGGIVFSTCPPDLDYYKQEAKTWFDLGYLYLGFIWIAEDKRNNNLGSFWLNELKKSQIEQKFWLMTEEERLHGFYHKNGFIMKKPVVHNNVSEWLYTYNPLLK